MAAIKTAKLALPASTDDLRKLEIGTVVYLTGRVFTAREGVYKRAIEDGFGMPASRDALGIVNFHCSPAAAVNADGSHTVGAVTATASFASAWVSDLLRTETDPQSLGSEIPYSSSLVSLGISADRLRIVSYGKEFPFDAGHDETAFSKNRRAHFVITAK